MMYFEGERVMVLDHPERGNYGIGWFNEEDIALMRRGEVLS